jgi:hypothetical protein
MLASMHHPLVLAHLAHDQPEHGHSSCWCSPGVRIFIDDAGHLMTMVDGKSRVIGVFGTILSAPSGATQHHSIRRGTAARARPECARYYRCGRTGIPARERVAPAMAHVYVFARDFQVLSFTPRTLIKRAGARRGVEQSSSDCRLLPWVLCHGRCPSARQCPTVRETKKSPSRGSPFPTLGPRGSLAAEAPRGTLQPVNCMPRSE